MRKINALLIAFVMAAAVLTFVSTPANAASVSLLCKGFKSCASKGYGNAGFSKVYKKQHWSMTPGHNCTNYVAYRLNSNGRVTTHKSGFNSAWTWNAAAKAHGITRTNKPRVGDVAWWAKNSAATKSGHVAYVEKVYSDGTVRVSEDNYRGDFGWKTFRPGRYYPGTFIRFPKSDGSAWGTIDSVKKSTDLITGRNRVTVTGWATESNFVGGARLLPSWDGPREAAEAGEGGAWVSTATQPIRHRFTWYWTWSASRQPPKRLYLYALNAPGTTGKDYFMGSVPTGW